MIHFSLSSEAEPVAGNDLTERQKELLMMAVSGYIVRTQPVSSLFLQEHNQIHFSSATIRSEFAELDEKGYLYSPYRSSGRIPTERGYRFYVNQLSEKRCLAEEDRKLIQSEYLKRDFRLEEVLGVSCKILSMLTDYAGVVLAPSAESAVLKHIELIDMGEDEVLVVLVTRSGMVYSKTIFLEQRIPGDALHRVSRYLNSILKGIDLEEIKERLANLPEHEERNLQFFLGMIARTVADHFDLVGGNVGFLTAGLDNLLVRVAAGNAERIKELNLLFNETDFLKGMFQTAADMEDVVVAIDGDRDVRLNGLSIVSSSYKIGERRTGSIGIVGPVCMDYTRVISIVEYMSLLMSNMLTRMSK